MSAQIAAAVVIGIAATIEDLWRRSVSNWIPLAALVSGVAWQISQKGISGILAAVLGAATGFGLLIVFYLLGGMGGGDVKLMAGFGALLGAGRSLEAAIWTGILGALMAAAVIAAHYLRRLWKKDQAGPPRAIPYAPAITAGVWLSLVPR